MKKTVLWILIICLTGVLTGTFFQSKAAEAGPHKGTVEPPAYTPSLEAESASDETEKTVPDKTPLVSWDGYQAYLLRSSVNKFEQSDASLYLYTRVLNNTDRTMTLKLSDVTIDGVPVNGAGIYNTPSGTDTGEDSQEYCLIIPREDTKEAGSDAIVQGKIVNATVALKDSDSQEVLYSQEVSIDLTALDGTRSVWEVNSSSNSEGRQTVVTTAVPYRTLKLWDRGDDVKRLQEKLIELNYLEDTADGSFGPNTAQAVQSFNEANHLSSGVSADASTQELLFSSEVKPYAEPWMTLTIGEQFEWETVQEDGGFFFRVQVRNQSKENTVRGYELRVYTTDVWGNEQEGEKILSQTMTRKVSPGETVFSESVYLENRESTYTVWVGIAKVVFTDGEVRETEDVDYYRCDLPGSETQ